ncbi:class I glutamine amidotransferase-like protein [Lophiotrema nucula]|uniref:Class I glutamine amidotransferase-like protein n=1 Tax=Lophiotrema nucula TaxID=690887 RepID=A0A6A5ZD11_9PLEO|nr:class I glutamine amidotransferase-like protein [Lophiotrema nucula]
MRLPRTFPLLATLFAPTLGIPLQPPIANTTALPINFAIVAFPGFQALDAFGPLDVFNSLSLLYSSNVTMHVKVVAATLDPVSTVVQSSPMMNMSHGDFGESIKPTHTFMQLLNKDTQGEVDVLIVPGGGGTREERLEEIAFIKATAPNAKYVISVCTGATLLARAGVLDGRKATSNKRAWSWVLTTGPKVEWVHTARWVHDGKYWTSSGVSAGIDVAYAWLEDVYGKGAADYVAMSGEYRRTTNASDDPFAAIWGDGAGGAVHLA